MIVFVTERVVPDSPVLVFEQCLVSGGIDLAEGADAFENTLNHPAVLLEGPNVEEGADVLPVKTGDDERGLRVHYLIVDGGL